MSLSNANPSGPAQNYLIVMREVVIAQDLALTITDSDPGAQVIIAATEAEAVAALGSVQSLVLAFIADRPARFARSGLARAVAQRGGRVVLLGDEAEATGPTKAWDVLEQPFNTDAVLAKLARR